MPKQERDVEKARRVSGRSLEFHQTLRKHAKDETLNTATKTEQMIDQVYPIIRQRLQNFRCSHDKPTTI